ncbi:hypothetical protein [Polymorphobacter sp.]|uniref:hypothetical protein n=1 Tax=Polymorphobacter sp. TaxID=1909290 RepID=UPI003F6F5E82
MAAAREVLGYIMGAIFAAAAMVMMGLAWLGLDHVLGWEWAAGVLAFSLVVRVNFFLLAGMYLFAHRVWGLPPMEAAMLVLPGLMYVAPSITLPLFGAISRPYSTT